MVECLVDFDEGMGLALSAGVLERPDHWTQTVWNTAQKLGLQVSYTKDEQVHRWLRRVLALPAEAIAPTLAALYEKSRGALTELARGLRRLVYTPFSGPKISDGGGMQDRVELKAMRGEEPLSSNARKLIWMGQSSRKRAKERGRSLEKVENSCSATWTDRSKKRVEEILDESYLSSESRGDEGQEGFIVHPLAWGSKSRGDEGQEGFRIHPLACGSKSLRKLKDSLDKVCSHRGAAFSRGETLWSLAKVENSCSATWTDRSNKRVGEILDKAYMYSESSGDEGQEGLRIHPLAWGSKSLRKLKDSIDKVCPHRGAAREPADDVEQAGTRGRPRAGNQKEKEPEAGRQFNRLKYGEWNTLPGTVTTAPTVESFRARLEACPP
ncbi:Hypp3496 [Branchiostoma lanceolatum]|uniref:Hypp3496 protein n=1 Tax=Branchiostoma lanceolatum TaxID=7740 RepID=A0A8K0EUM3_BRALA|nr:Hypp3496 [Branchiostoma lanceolatum]